MKPQDEFAVIVAGVVTASTFQLIDATGAIVAELGTTTVLGITAPSLTFRHLDSAVIDSQIGWTAPGPSAGIARTSLTGPTRVAAGPGGTRTPPEVYVAVSGGTGGTSAGLLSGSSYGGVTTPGQGSVVVSSNPASIDSAYAQVDASGSSGTGRAVYVQSTSLQLEHDTAVVTNYRLAQRFRADASQALMRVGNSGGYVQAAADHVGLGPTAAGRLFLNARTGYLTTAVEQFVMPASISPGYASFIMNGIAFTGADGDVVEITATIRVLCGVSAGAFIAHPQIFGPGGNVILPQRVIATQWPVNHDAPITGTWRYTLALGGGAYAATIIGGQTGGTWTAVAPDTWMGLTNHGIR